jgi:hypothetical protein
MKLPTAVRRAAVMTMLVMEVPWLSDSFNAY